MAYLPIHRSAFEVDTRDPLHPTVHLEVMIDGNSAYKSVSLSHRTIARSQTKIVSDW